MRSGLGVGRGNRTVCLRATDDAVLFATQQSAAKAVRMTSFGKPQMLAKNLLKTFCTSDKMTDPAAIRVLSCSNKDILRFNFLFLNLKKKHGPAYIPFFFSHGTL